MEEEQTTGFDPLYSFWIAQINSYDKSAEKWQKRAKKIVKRYIDERSENNNRSRYNVLWSNIQTLLPALYDRAPNPNIERRFQDDDDLGRICSEVLERSVSYFVKSDDFNECMKQAVLDRLLVGRGTTWVRYMPNFKDRALQGSLEEVAQEGVQLSDDVQIGDDANVELYSEDVVVDYVHSSDFGHTQARTWQELRAVWRKVEMDRKSLKERFGEELGALIPLNSQKLEDSEEKRESRACIYEIWDRSKKRVIWLSKDYPKILDEREDPLGLKTFFPCPKPLYATLTNDSLIPTPDFILYQDQAKELDRLTGRIEVLTEALKVAGAYDASAEGIQKLLSSNVDNILVPVDSAALLAEKGGLKGVMTFLPIQEIATVLNQLYEVRERVKADLYEITGMSDIVRGASNANETATAQQIKGQYASMRLGNMQKDVARFACDLVRLMTEIIAEHFSFETIKQISGVRLLTENEKALLQFKIQNNQQISQEEGQLLSKPTWNEVVSVLQDDAARCFRVDIETDSTIKGDQEAEKAARIEFLSAVGGFLQQSQTAPPDLQPMLAQMLLFGVRAFKVGRELESTIKIAMDKLQQKADAPAQNLAPDPMIEIKQRELSLKEREIALKEQEVQNNKDVDILKAQLSAPIENIMQNLAIAISEGMRSVAKSNMDAAMVQRDAVNEMSQSNKMLVAAVTAPKETQLIRGQDGKAISSVTRTVM